MSFLSIFRKIIKKAAVTALIFTAVTGSIPTASASAATDSWPDCPSIKAGSAVVMNVDTGTVLFEKEGTKKEYPASITKVMTALLALENCSSLSEDVEFTDEAINTGDNESSSIGMQIGEKLSLENALHGMLLASANEVANAIAIHVGGSVDNFVGMMNEKARELGCVNTHFANPCGLYNENHYTCAYDMALIAREAARHPDFVRIAGLKKYVIPKTNKIDETRPIANTHQMINPAENPEYGYEYCYAGKTGYTSEAGYTLVSCAKKGSMDVVCVVMKAGCRADQYESSLKLLDHTFKRFRMETSDKVTLDPAVSGSALYTRILKKDPVAVFTASGPAMLSIPKKCDFDSVITDCTYDDSITSVKEGANIVGTIDYIYRDHKIGQTELIYTGTQNLSLIEATAPASQSAVEVSAEEYSAGLNTFFTNIRNFLFDSKKGIITLLVIAAVVIIFIIYDIKVLRPRRKRRKRYMMHKRLRKSSGIDKRHIRF